MSIAQPKQQQKPELQTLHGTVCRSVFYNAENGFCVLNVRLKEGLEAEEDIIQVSGNLANRVREGDEYCFTGAWTKHPRYGRQFKFQDAELILPSGKKGVARYLSGITYGVGLAKAQKIIEALGEDCLTKIQEDPSVLNELDFLNDVQREEIAEDLSKNSVQAELAGMICREGIGKGLVAKIMAKYGRDSVRKVKENPYILADEVWGIGFKKADTVAAAVGIEPSSPFRIEAAVNYVLNEAGAEGHVFLKPSTIMALTVGKKGLIADSGVGVPEIAAASGKLISEQKCVREGDCIYSKKLYDAEKSVAAGIKRLLASEQVISVDDLDDMVSAIEQGESIEYASQQREAIRISLSNTISIITGGPGTGKTTVINAICRIYEEAFPDNVIYLAAPTGRASKRMSEATGLPAYTIHRLLRYSPQHGGFEYGVGNPLPGPGLLIVDESSMIDIELAADLLEAVEDLQVVLVGDVDQLPSVGPGSVLRDCILSNQVPTVRLEFNYRQAGGSKVAEYANIICRGQVPPLVTAGDFEFLEVEDAVQAAACVPPLVRGYLEAGYGQMDFQVLAPMRRGSCGVTALNDVVREIVNPDSGDKLKLGQYRLGDKVLVIKNNYTLGVFNGDLGEIVAIEKGIMTVDFGDFTQKFSDENLKLLTLAYATTVHKSQGSEFPVVIMPLVRQHYMMLQRNLLYTGMTRAKKRLVLIADRWSVERAIKNNVIEERFSMLAERLRGEE